MNQEKKYLLQRKCNIASREKHITELARDHLRYEAIRKLSPVDFAELHKRNLAGEFFDDMVDELVIQP